MIHLLKKKINILILLIFMYFSLNNISKFGNYVETISNPDDMLNITYFDDELNEVSPVDQDYYQRTELIKKQKDSDLKNIDYVEYTDQSIASDALIEENDLNQSLIPVYPTMLFSGVPIPESKPIPEEIQYQKSVFVSVKNKKSLKENLNKFLDEDESENAFNQISNEIDFKTKENLKFFLDEMDNVVEISSFVDGMRQLNLRRNYNYNFVFFYVKAPTETKVIRNRMRVKNSVNSTLKSAKIPTLIVDEFINQLSFNIDFQRDIKKGDLIEILYEGNFTSSNNLVGKPKLLYGLMLLTDYKFEMFRYRLSNGKSDYFDANGKSIRKYLMRTPLKGARLSSKFGMRKHPILGYSKMHRGVDFSAKRGTPIMAAGDGRITFAGRNGSFGRFIEIKHLNNFSTRYAHLYKYAKGIKKGKLVKQGDIIGYVGTSGRSTGPHLHYEVKHKNRTINPMKLKLESSLNVDDLEMPNFYASISLTRERFLATRLQETDTAKFQFRN